jgi:hypothetical protein
MKPHLWLPLALLALSAGGAVLLAQPACTPIGPEQYQWFWSRHAWQSAFDSLSTVCGSGLTTRRLRSEYTDLGRWTLLGLGELGALLFLAAAAQAARGPLRRVTFRECLTTPHDVRRVVDTPGAAAARSAAPAPSGPPIRAPVTVVPIASRPPARPLAGPAIVLAAFLALQAVVVAAFALLARLACPTAPWTDAVWMTASAFCSLGLPESPDVGTGTLLAAAGLIGGLGWPVWLLVVPRFARRFVALRAALLLAGGYLLYLALAAAIVAAVETPRGPVRRAQPDDAASSSMIAARYGRSVVLVVNASTSGVAAEPLGTGHLRDATRFIIATVAWIGPLGGSAGGGLKWTLVVAAIGATALAGRFTRSGDARRTLSIAAAACLGLMLLLGLTTAVGLLLVENWTAAPFQPAPTAADAWLEAACAVAGGNVSSGLTAVVTSPNLVSGLNQTTNQYALGMSWLMAAMLLGRVLPVFVLARVVAAAPPDERRLPYPPI